jgi:two-component system, NarL family, nitrate/nitrite response regulator NarL
VNTHNDVPANAGRPRVRVLIIEDHQPLSDALSSLLQDQPDLHVVGTATSSAEAVARVSAFSPEVVVIDFHLGDYTLPQALRQLAPNVHTIFVSRSDGDAARLQALESGASAFIYRSSPATDVVAAIRAVARGCSLFSPLEVSRLLGWRRQLDSSERLTERETEVLHLMAAGRSSRQIAEQLGISYATVRGHVRAIERKLDTHSKLGAITRAREIGLVE